MPGADLVWTVGRDEDGTRLDKFLAHGSRLGSRARAGAAIERGKVYLNGAVTEQAAARLTAGSEVRVWMHKPGSARRPVRSGYRTGLDLLYEDDTLLVVNKPPGILTVPLERRPDAPSVAEAIRLYLRSSGKRQPHVVHRIDQDTSGLVVFAKDARTQRGLQQQFARREPERVYWAVVYGCPATPAGTWRDRIVWDTSALVQKPAGARDPRGLDAICGYRTIECFRGASLIEVTLHTGRRNQIRIQAHLHGHPLVGEERYTDPPDSAGRISFRRHALHARRLSFLHPSDDRPLRFEAPLPRDFTDLLARLRKGGRVAPAASVG